MPHLVKDCECEDWPCCEHADNYAYTSEEFDEAFYCGDCGIAHAGACVEDRDDDDEDEDDYDVAIDGCRVHGIVGCGDPECDPHGVFHSELVQNEAWGGTS